MQTAEKTPGPTQQSGIYGHRCGGWNPHPICERGTGWPASGISPVVGSMSVEAVPRGAAC